MDKKYAYNGSINFLYRIEDAGNNTFICAYYSQCGGVMLIDGVSGDTIWTSQHIPGISPYYIYDVKKTSDGGYAYCGPWGSYGYFVKLDSFGNTQWTSVYDVANNFSPILFYPNPSISTISISTSVFQNEPNLVFTLFDVSGKVVLQKDFHQGDETDVSKFSDGIYFGEVKSKTKTVRGKIVIQH